jgi:hypothetical protein
MAEYPRRLNSIIFTILELFTLIGILHIEGLMAVTMIEYPPLLLLVIIPHLWAVAYQIVSPRCPDTLLKLCPFHLKYSHMVLSSPVFTEYYFFSRFGYCIPLLNTHVLNSSFPGTSQASFVGSIPPLI